MSVTVKNIFEYLNELFPTDTAADFDNVGLLVGNPDSVVDNTLIALDCTAETVTKAIENKCNLIITHHPVIFNPLKNVLSGSVVFELIRNNISVISMHTNLDIAKDGVSETLCSVLGATEICSQTASDGFTLKSGVISPISAKSLADKIKATLGGNVRYVDGGNEISSFLVCSGSGGEFIFDALRLGFDAFISSEIKHKQFLFAKDNGISVFDAGHFCTENIIVEPLNKLLSDKFKDITFIPYHSESIKYL